MQLADKIGEGNFRECFAVRNEPGLCVKRLKPQPGFFRRLSIFVLRRDINREEFDIYNRLPDDLKPYFNPVLEFTGDYLVTSRPVDYDGKHSKPVCEYGKISNVLFWEEISKLLDLFEKHNIWFFDAFLKGRNVFVKKRSKDEWVPIIVDYKRLGWKAYPVQVNLVLDSEKRKKFYRYFRRFETNFRAHQ